MSCLLIIRACFEVFGTWMAWVTEGAEVGVLKVCFPRACHRE